MLLLLLLLGAGASTDVELAAHHSGAKVLVDVMMKDDYSLYPEIVSAVACTAIDLNMDKEKMCSTDGFERTPVYPPPHDRNVADVFGGHLRSRSRLVMNARTVKESVPLVYVEVGIKVRRPDEQYVNGGGVTRMVLRVDRKVREAAAAVERGQVDTLDVLGPAPEAAALLGVPREYQLAGILAIPALAVVFVLGSAMKRRLSRAVSAIRQRKRGPKRHDDDDLETGAFIVLVDDTPAAEEQARKDEALAVKKGLLRPRDRGVLRRDAL